MRKVIEASQGHILTNGETFGRIIYLAKGEDESRYYEITEAEYETLTSVDEPVF